ncbi:enoyl-CoA hydratase/isomerase family protein [soil metagenome]
MSQPAAIFDYITTANGLRFGVATLNSPASLNSVSLDMVRLLTPQLRLWSDDPTIVGVLLQAAGDKAFCAGGDLRRLYPNLIEPSPNRGQEAATFFAEEYELDYLIHTFPKPILCWGHGIVMGGGVGLMMGASHRVVTKQSVLAMPEIKIGLYPDVGGSWKLRRMPGHTGLFMALTAANLNAADAIYCGLADVILPNERKADVVESIRNQPWSGDAIANRAALSRLLDSAQTIGDFAVAGNESKLKQHRGTIDALMDGEDLMAIASRLRALQSDDPWLSEAAKNFVTGSPTTAALSFALWQRVPGMSLADVFRLEYWASLGCCAHTDFAEGIRAMLIDKDRRPVWSPKTLEEVTSKHVEDHLRPRGEMPRGLASLGATIGSRATGATLS